MSHTDSFLLLSRLEHTRRATQNTCTAGQVDTWVPAPTRESPPCRGTAGDNHALLLFGCVRLRVVQLWEAMPSVPDASPSAGALAPGRPFAPGLPLMSEVPPPFPRRSPWEAGRRRHEPHREEEAKQGACSTNGGACLGSQCQGPAPTQLPSGWGPESSG